MGDVQITTIVCSTIICLILGFMAYLAWRVEKETQERIHTLGLWQSRERERSDARWAHTFAQIEQATQQYRSQSERILQDHSAIMRMIFERVDKKEDRD